MTIMTFASIQSVIDFQGEEYQLAYVPAAARQVLKHWDRTAQHYEVVETRSPDRQPRAGPPLHPSAA